MNIKFYLKLITPLLLIFSLNKAMNKVALTPDLREKLNRALLKENAKDINTYLKQGLDPNTIFDEQTGYTLLHHAANVRYTNNFRVLAALINAGAQVNAKSLRGLTPLHCAAYYHNNANTLILLCAGADPNLCTVKGATPLHFATEDVVQPKDISCLKLLLAAGGCVESIDKEGRTVLNFAENSKNAAIISLLKNSLEHMHDERNILARFLAYDLLRLTNGRLPNLPIEIAQECVQFMKFKPYFNGNLGIEEEYAQEIKNCLGIKKLPAWLIMYKDRLKQDGHIFNTAYSTAIIVLGGKMLFMGTTSPTMLTAGAAFSIVGASYILPRICFQLHTLNLPVKPLIVDTKEATVGILIGTALLYATKNHPKSACVAALGVIAGCTAFTSLLKINDILRTMGSN